MSGCAAPYPVPVNRPVTFQQNFDAAAHWRLLARDTAVQLAQSAAVPAGATLAVAVPSFASQFEIVFEDLLVSEITAQGITVAARPIGAAMKLGITTHVVAHPGREPQDWRGAVQLVSLGALGSGVWRGVVGAPGAAAIAGIGLGAAGLVAASTLGPDTTTEIVVSSRLTQGDRVVWSHSDIYYVQDAEAGLYTPLAPPGSGPKAADTVVYTQTGVGGDGLEDITRQAQLFCAQTGRVARLQSRYDDGDQFNSVFACVNPRG